MSFASEEVLQQPERSAVPRPQSAPVALAALSHLKALEAESIYILREAAAEFARPVMLYSIGKDSSVMLRLAQKAFFPGKIPFPLLHIDTSYKFPEMIRVSRLVHAADRRGIDRPSEPRSAGGRRQSLLPGHAEMLRLAENEIPAGRSGRRRIRCRVWRRAPRRRKIARQGTHLFVPRRAGPVGSQKPAARTVEYFQLAHKQGRKHSRVSALELDGAGHLALHPHGKNSHRSAVFRAASAKSLFAADRSSCAIRATGCCRANKRRWCNAACARWDACHAPARFVPTRTPFPKSSRRWFRSGARSARTA